MQIRTGHAWMGALVLFIAALAGAAQAQSGKSIRTEAEFIAFDAAANTVTVKVTKPGSGKHAEKLRRGREAVFKVKPTGSVLSRTTVSIEGRKANIGDIPAGKTVNVYWRPDEADKTLRFARKIDVIMTLEEFDKRYGTD